MLKQTIGGTSRGLKNIKSNRNMSRSDWICSPIHRYRLNNSKWTLSTKISEGWRCLLPRWANGLPGLIFVPARNNRSAGCSGKHCGFMSVFCECWDFFKCQHFLVQPQPCGKMTRPRARPKSPGCYQHRVDSGLFRTRDGMFTACPAESYCTVSYHVHLAASSSIILYISKLTISCII